MKKILILFGEKDWKEKVFADDTYQYSYETMYDFFYKNNIELYRASYTWYDSDQKVFSNAWRFIDGTWTRCHNIKPDVILDKTTSKTKRTDTVQNLSTIFPFVNPLHFSALLDNKRLLPLLFAKYTKKQIDILCPEDINQILLLNSDRVVVKPADSSGGANVNVFSKKDAYQFICSQENPYLWIVQEFVDSKNGIPLIMTGVHDLRIVMINQKISYTYYRQPSKDSLIANLSLGGTKQIIDQNQLPNDLLEIIKHTNTIFSQFKNTCYSIDCMFDENNHPWIIELNSAPGMFFEAKDKATFEKVYTDLVSLFNAI